MRKYIVDLIVAFGLVASVASFLVTEHLWRLRMENYGLRVGMTKSEVQMKTGRPADGKLEFAQDSSGPALHAWGEERLIVLVKGGRVAGVSYKRPLSMLERLRLVFGGNAPSVAPVSKNMGGL